MAAILMLTGCTFVKIPNGQSFSKPYISLGNNVKVLYDVADYSSVELYVAADVEYSVSDTPQVEISALQGIHDRLLVTSENGVLRIETRDKAKIQNKNIIITLSSSTLGSMTINGAADVDIKPGLKTESFNLEVNGAGDITLGEIETGKLDVEINGAGDINADLRGEAMVNVEINGAGDITLKGQAHSVEAKVNGAGDIDTSGLECTNIKKNILGLCRLKKNK